MNYLQEKIMKAQNVIKTFNDFLSDEKVKNNSYTQEIALHWKEIESFLEDSKIVFEFECYLNTNKSARVISLKSIIDNIYNFVVAFFPEDLNDHAWNKIDKKAKEKNLTREEFLNSYPNVYEIWLDFSLASTYGYGEELANDMFIKLEKVNKSFLLDKIKEVFNTDKVIQSDNYHKHKKQDYPDHWFIEPDGSLSSKFDGFVPFEIVSPYTSIKEAPKVLEKFKKEVFDFFEGKTDETTGGHINITCPHSKLDFVKLVLLADDHIWLKTFSREFNNYCQSQYKSVIEQIKDLPSGLEFNKIVSRLEVDFEKYRSFNFLKTSPPTVEFRVPGEDYLGSKFENTKKSLNWLVFVIAIGMNRTLFRQEYISKVMRIYSKSRKFKVESKISPFVKKLIYFLKDNDDEMAQESLDSLFYEMFSFLVRNKPIKLTRDDLTAFDDFSFQSTASSSGLKGEKYKTRFTKLMYAYLSQEHFISLVKREYTLKDISHVKKIIKQAIYPESSELTFKLNEYEEDFQKDISSAIQEFIRLCSLLKLNWTFFDFKRLDVA